MDSQDRPYVFFLGGQDLEMVTIKKLVHDSGQKYFDKNLNWGASVSDYQNEVEQELKNGNCPVLIELSRDPVHKSLLKNCLVLDHHNELAGEHRKTPLRQVFELLKLPESDWTDEFRLVDANDIGSIAGLKLVGASIEEILRVRKLDRRAQGITEEDEQFVIPSLDSVETHLGGRLNVVQIPNHRTAIATDFLSKEFGGPGFENLLVFSPGQVHFYGQGSVVKVLGKKFSGSWFGGRLPVQGYWGWNFEGDRQKFVQDVISVFDKKVSADIPVTAFHQTVLWPVMLRGPKKSPNDSSMKEITDALEKCGWTESQDQTNYEETVYFLPFVRDFLYGDGKQDRLRRTIRRFNRSDLNSISIEYGKREVEDSDGKKKVTFQSELKVERAEILLIRPRIAVLLLEFSNRTADAAAPVPVVHDQRDDSLNLEKVLYLQSQLRMVFPPYFTNDGHGGCCSAVRWNKKDAAGPFSTCTGGEEFREFTKIGAEPPVYQHWQYLFQDGDGKDLIQPLSSANDLDEGGLYYQQLLDERMPSLSFLAVEKPSEIMQEDEDRFPAMDDPALNYQKEFRDRLREDFQYQRFRHYGTTYYCNGTSFSVVCNDFQDSDKECFSDLLLTHYRCHYTKMALIVQYQHAALLYFLDELADIAREVELKAVDGFSEEPGWVKRLSVLQERFLKFRTRSFFTEVSSQIQGKDLFQFWQSHLKTDRLFERVSATCSDLHEASENEKLKKLTILQANMAKDQERISKLATWGSVAIIGLTVAGTVVGFKAIFSEKYDLTIFSTAVVLGISASLISATYLICSSMFRKK